MQSSRTALSSLALGCVLVAGCGGSSSESRDPQAAPLADGRGAGPAPIVQTPAPAGSPTSTGDDPQISRSVGVESGVVVLWPRIVLPTGSSGPDAETRRIAREVQRHLAGVAARALPGSAGDMRPEPERVCPRAGCKAVSVGALLARAGKGCAVVAWVSKPGKSPMQLVPWTGLITLDQQTVPFREHPERVVHVKDYKRCSDIPGSLKHKAGAVQAAIKQAAGR